MKQVLVCILCLSVSLHAFGQRNYNGPYSGKFLDRVAFPIGGMGAGMFCLEGTGAVSHMSVRHHMDFFNEPGMFAAIHLKGVKNGSKVLEIKCPDWKKFGRPKSGRGNGQTLLGMPRFDNGQFTSRFPFAEIVLQDQDIPIDIRITGWSPFIPTDADNSGLPVGALEYTFTNTSDEAVEAVFYYGANNNFMSANHKTAAASILPTATGFILTQEAVPDGREPWVEGHFAIFTGDPATVVNHCWFRSVWFDPLTFAWRDISEGKLTSNPPSNDAKAASLAVPLKLGRGESKTVKVHLAWYVPSSGNHIGGDARNDRDRGPCYDPADYEEIPYYYKPWYASRFESIDDVIAYWRTHYDDLRKKSELFADAFHASTLPPEVTEAVAANLSILKSPTVMRQHDGRLWCWEGNNDSNGSCHGTCTHVWNYAQALPHLFPDMERTLRETEFMVDQDSRGHQTFRANLPIRPVEHGFHAACDGQLGGIVKAYRDWRISGDTEWIKRLYPLIKSSIDYCIRTWDPKEKGVIEEPHHNTYDIEFWGPEGMSMSFYAAALRTMVELSKTFRDDPTRYESLLHKCLAYMNGKLFNGEYFVQEIRWTDLQVPDPTQQERYYRGYSPEETAVLMQEGPKYQFGKGCLSDGVIGGWMIRTAGLDDPMDPKKTASHLRSVHRYNYLPSMKNHANPQRPTFAMGADDGGLVLCSWPHGGQPSRPFVYSNEVWTGIEYQVAAHLIFLGETEKGLEIIRTVRNRYDGRVRNPFNEYECGHWYARAMSSYSLLQALTGIRYDAVDKTLYIDPATDGDFTSFLSTAGGFGTVELKNGKPAVTTYYGNIDIRHCMLRGKKAKVRTVNL